MDRVVGQLLKDRTAEATAKAVLQAEALERLIDRQLVMNHLAARRMGARPEEVRLAVERFSEQLEPQGLTLADYLTKTGCDRAGLEREFAWDLGWQRYLKQYLTDENLAKFFEQRRRDFDGTEIRTAHILLKVEPDRDAGQWDERLQRGAALLEEIRAGKLSFEAAAEKVSQAPTAREGGDIGFISRHNMMPEEFARAAFSLDEGEISEPVVTSFGVHLIKCLDVKPGSKRWTDVRGDLQPVAARYLFQRIVDRERPAATVEYTGDVPHFRPGTKVLAD